MLQHAVMVVDEWHNNGPQDLITVSLCIQNAINKMHLSRICLSSYPANLTHTRPHLISPEPQSSAPAPHLILITPTFINTSTRALPRAVLLIEHWTQAPDHLPFSSFIIINKTYSPSLLVSQSRSVTAPVFLVYNICLPIP